MRIRMYDYCSSMQVDFSILFSCLDIKHVCTLTSCMTYKYEICGLQIIQLFSAMLMERRIIFCAEKLRLAHVHMYVYTCVCKSTLKFLHIIIYLFLLLYVIIFTLLKVRLKEQLWLHSQHYIDKICSKFKYSIEIISINTAITYSIL